MLLFCLGFEMFEARVHSQECPQGTSGLHNHFSNWCWKSQVLAGLQVCVEVSAELRTDKNLSTTACTLHFAKSFMLVFKWFTQIIQTLNKSEWDAISYRHEQHTHTVPLEVMSVDTYWTVMDQSFLLQDSSRIHGTVLWHRIQGGKSLGWWVYTHSCNCDSTSQWDRKWFHS